MSFPSTGSPWEYDRYRFIEHRITISDMPIKAMEPILDFKLFEKVNRMSADAIRVRLRQAPSKYEVKLLRARLEELHRERDRRRGQQ